MLKTEFVLNLLFSQKKDIFDPKVHIFYHFWEKITSWQNGDVNKNLPQTFFLIIFMFVGSNKKRMKFIALVVFKKDCFYSECLKSKMPAT